MSRMGVVLVALLGVLATASQGRAQAICSAPHSSPTLAQSGSVGTLPPGSGWVQLSVLGQNATQSFNPLGDRQDFLGGSEFETRSVYLTGAVAVAEGVEVWGQLPLHRLRAGGGVLESTSQGVGDLRAAVRVSSAIVDREWPVALRAGLKVPGSDFPVDPIVLPLTEGQTDLELSLESGWVDEWTSLYVVGWVGYRWRGENAGALYRPGNERFVHVAVGGSLGAVRFELGADGLWGSDPVEQGIRLTNADRRLLQLLPTVGTNVGPGSLELTVPVPVSGKNLPASAGVSLGYRLLWGS